MDDTLGKFIVRRREELGLLQSQLAERADLPATTINRVEKGVTKLPSADARRRLARALAVSHLDLLVAAGEIGRQEVEEAGVTARSPEAGLPASILAALHRVQEWPRWKVTFMLNAIDNMNDLDKQIIEISERGGEIVIDPTLEGDEQ